MASSSIIPYKLIMDADLMAQTASSALAKLLAKDVAALRASSDQGVQVQWQTMNATWEANRLAKESFTLQLLQQPRYRDPRHLAHREFKGFSQSGEDGVVKAIFERIGTTNQSFVEIGVGPDLENNTAFWLSQGWKGVWMDCLPLENVQKAPGLKRFLESGALQYISAMITAENVESLLAPRLASPEPDLFSLDLDRSTYHVWKGMEFLRPRVLVLEYNSFYPPPIRWTVREEDQNMDWTTMHFGGSLAAFCDLAQQRGYELVHCGLTGVNAFFVRRELLTEDFYRPSSPWDFFEPYRAFLTYNHPCRGRSERNGLGRANQLCNTSPRQSF